MASKIRQQRVITYRYPGAAENAKRLGVSYSAYISWLQTGTKNIGPAKRARVEIVEVDGRGDRVPIEGIKSRPADGGRQDSTKSGGIHSFCTTETMKLSFREKR